MDPITALNAFKAIEKIPTALQMAQTDIASRTAENIAVENLAAKYSQLSDVGKPAMEMSRTLNESKELAVANPELKERYINHLQELSPCRETIPDKPLIESDWKRISPEEVLNKRLEFNEIRNDLKKEWSELNGQEWPQYNHDVYSDNGNLIRRAGNDYDAHHIRPLCLGGENSAENITPLHASDHYDKQGIHAVGTPYDLMSR